MRPPKNLKDEGLEFWRKHFKRLVDAGQLDPDQDTEAFVLLCQIWYALQQTDPIDPDGKAGARYGSMLKRFTEYGKQFGFLAKDRKATAPPKDFGEALAELTG